MAFEIKLGTELGGVTFCMDPKKHPQTSVNSMQIANTNIMKTQRVFKSQRGVCYLDACILIGRAV